MKRHFCTNTISREGRHSLKFYSSHETFTVVVFWEKYLPRYSFRQISNYRNIKSHAINFQACSTLRCWSVTNFQALPSCSGLICICEIYTIFISWLCCIPDDRKYHKLSPHNQSMALYPYVPYLRKSIPDLLSPRASQYSDDSSLVVWRSSWRIDVHFDRAR